MSETKNSSLLGKITVLVIISCCSLPIQAKYGGGTGEPNDPYLIYTANQMNAIGADSNDWDKHFKLMADIDLSGFTGTAFNIIGERYYDSGWVENPFTGVFDGNVHTISNFTYDSNDTGYIGLFGYIDDPNAEIKNLGMIDPNVDAGTGSSLVGYLKDGTITNCYAEGGSVSGSGGYWGSVGGLVGDNSGTINNCYSEADVSGAQYVGGLVGGNSGIITNCYSSGSVSGASRVGGLVGDNGGTITKSYSETDVLGTNMVGGLVGIMWRGTITNCYSIGSVSGNYHVGGLVGANGFYHYPGEHWSEGGTISNCYSTGSVSGTTDVGGLVGFNYGTITNCYSTGSVSGETEVGGLVGQSLRVVHGSYWDTDTSGQSTSAGGTGLPTAEMQMQITFTDAGWDFENIWWILEGAGYPRLWWEEKYGGGSGHPNNPYLIYMAEQMNTIGACQRDWDKHFKLMADIDLSGFTGTSFNIIGTDEPWRPFTGVFDGNGHTISNFTYTSTDGIGVGLFGYVRWGAYLKDVGLIDPDVDAGTAWEVGALVGWLGGTVTNCYAEGGSVTGYRYVGGLVGSNLGTISNCYSVADVSGDWYVGGLVGSNSGTIANCYSADGVMGDESVGGLVGYNDGTITNCYSEGDVSGEQEIGGLVGTNGEFFFIEHSGAWPSPGTISNCYSSASVSGSYSVGGLVGWNWVGTISKCSVEGGSVVGSGAIGGLVGTNTRGGCGWCSYPPGCVPSCYFTTISNSYSTASVSGENNVGGLVGQNAGFLRGGGTISNCYSTGSVTGTETVGGLVGVNDGTVSASFWDIEASGQTTSAGGTGKTTAGMQTASTFIQWWGCEPVWTIDEGKDYPRLLWENMPGEPIPNPYGGGSGDPNDPYLIYTAEQLNTIGLIPCLWYKQFKLMADIDLGQYTGIEFNIIGTESYPFTGVFDGNGKKIFNFTYTSNEKSEIGLFRIIDGENAVIKDLGLIDPNVDAGSGNNVGSLVGWIDNGTITNCYVEGGGVSGDSYVGGLVGKNKNGAISNCYATGSVFGHYFVGGLVGYNENGIVDCYTSGNVTGGYYSHSIGGLCGKSTGPDHGTGQSSIQNCYSTATVTGNGSAGGLIGHSGAIVTGCYSRGGVSGDYYVGGLIGSNGGHGRISDCYSTGSVTGDQSFGGLAGYNQGAISASFWDVETSEQTTSAGGTGLPTDQMQMQITFADAGWDFTTPVWTINDGVDYPRLWWEFVPVLHAEPEVTLGISNTISWEPVVGAANEYYAECAEDANFTSIIYNTGWITETSCEFTGLELGERYWYSVKARNAEGTETYWSNVESSLQVTLADAVDMTLDAESLKNENMKNALLNKIDAVLKMIEEANYTGALSKLRNDILAKMNGCGEKGEPDKNDWIITCEEQSEQYPLVIETIEYVRSLME